MGSERASDSNSKKMRRPDKGAAEPAQPAPAGTVVQPFEGASPLPVARPRPSAPGAKAQDAPAGTVVQGFLGDDLERTPVSTDGSATRRLPSEGRLPKRLGDELECTPATTDPSLTARVAPLSTGGHQVPWGASKPDLEGPSATERLPIGSDVLAFAGVLPYPRASGSQPGAGASAPGVDDDTESTAVSSVPDPTAGQPSPDITNPGGDSVPTEFNAMPSAPHPAPSLPPSLPPPLPPRGASAQSLEDGATESTSVSGTMDPFAGPAPSATAPRDRAEGVPPVLAPAAHPPLRPAPPAPLPGPPLPARGSFLESMPPTKSSAVDFEATLPLTPLRPSKPSPDARAEPARPPVEEKPRRGRPPRPVMEEPHGRRPIQARLARLTGMFTRAEDQKTSVWRVLLLGVAMGLVVVGIVAAVYIRNHPARPTAAAPAPSKLKEFGTQTKDPGKSVTDSFDDAVDFARRK